MVSWWFFSFLQLFHDKTLQLPPITFLKKVYNSLITNTSSLYAIQLQNFTKIQPHSGAFNWELNYANFALESQLSTCSNEWEISCSPLKFPDFCMEYMHNGAPANSFQMLSVHYSIFRLSFRTCTDSSYSYSILHYMFVGCAFAWEILDFFETNTCSPNI